MFGIFYTLFALIGSTVWDIKEKKYNYDAFKLTYNPKTNTYLDYKGVERRPNGEICKTSIDLNGDKVQRDKNYKIVRNFTQEERNRQASNPECTVIKLSENNFHTNFLVEPVGIRYKDKDTGREFVIRSLKVPNCGIVYFYMDVNTCHLVRITDGQKKYRTNHNNETILDFIKKFNINQDNIIDCKWIKFHNDENRQDAKPNVL